MGIEGIFDADESVREGWARDRDDEISVDGYNAFIQITTNDGTTGFIVSDSDGAVTFYAKSDGDGYVAKNLGVGKINPTEALDVSGTVKADGLQLVAGAQAGYVLTSAANGVATWQDAYVAGGGITELEHRDLDQLVHLVAESSFEEITYGPGNIVSSITTWTGVGKTTKVREEQFTYSSLNQVTQSIIIQYDTAGIEIERITESFTYSAGRVDNITRVLT